MPDLSPKATVLINKYTPGEIAERLVKQEELSANLEYDNAKNLAMATEEQQLRYRAEANVDKWKTEANRLYGVGQDIEELRVQLEADNTAQAQTIKAAHIRTAEISTRYNECQREVDGLRLAASSLLGLIDCLGGRWSLDDAGPDRKQLAELVDYPKVLDALEAGGDDEATD